ncbi:MAG: hypothetical protein RBU45_26195, partial [Myxococcota bacterium]|nr:hypothetical protein [Myxococcota bacterium]
SEGEGDGAGREGEGDGREGEGEGEGSEGEGEGEGGLPLDFEALVSPCGGWGVDPQYLAEGAIGEAPEGGYCAAEVGFWRYDGAGDSLLLLDQRVELNCCGKRTIIPVWDGSTLTVTERDEPPPDGSRCRCNCVYDFAVRIWGGLPGVDELPLRLVREVVDVAGQPATVTEVFADTLPLDLDAGVQALAASAAATCQEPHCGEACLALCSATCHQREVCAAEWESEYDEAECLHQCKATIRRMPELVEEAFIVAFSECMGGDECQWDDACFSAGLAAAAPDFQDDPLFATCMARHEACDSEDGGFSDDPCYYLFILQESVRSSAAECLQRECDEVSDCLQGYFDVPL